jgi:ribosome-binding protein aMBF1 (putative translation factor)
MTDADKLRDQLARLGISQRGLARELDLDERTVRRYCAGELPVPRVVWLSLEALASRSPKPR